MTAGNKTVELNGESSDFIQSLVQLSASGSIGEMYRKVEAYRSPDNPGFIDARKKVDAWFLTFYAALAKLGEKDFNKIARSSFVQAFDSDPAQFVQGNESINIFF